MKKDWLEQLRGMVLGRQFDLDEMLRLIVDEVTRRLKADRGTLYLVDHARGELVSRVAHLPEISEIRLRLGEGVAGWVAKNGASLNVPRGTTDPRFTRRIDEQTGYKTSSLVAVPVVGSAGSAIGVLQLLNKQGGQAFDGDDEELLTELASEVASLLESTSLRSQLRPGHKLPLSFRFNQIVGESGAMLQAYERTARAAQTEATVLIRGESGTGKELIARAIHWNSKRKEGPFVRVDCAALPENLIENELFGHEAGAFTGADRASDGKLQAAAGGTLFLDEVGELTLPVQGKLLGLLQERTFYKVGGTRPLKADVRFVCATHRDLEKLVGEGKFRLDLYYRLRVVEVEVPPLRERGHGDLDRLIEHFVYENGRRHSRPNLQLTPRARAALHAHGWPGNVRELEHAIESAVVLAPGSELTEDLFRFGGGTQGAAHGCGAPAQGRFGAEILPLAQMERQYIEHAVALCDGNRSEAARRLGIGRNTLNRKLGA